MNMGDLKKVLDSCPTNVALGYARSRPNETDELAPPEEVVVVLAFTEKGFGFGEVSIHQTQEGVFLDTECMSLDRVKRYFNSLLDKAILDTDEDPERHKLYNRVMGRHCGDGCPVCNNG